MAKTSMRLLVMLVLISALQALVPATESRLPTLAGSRVPMKYLDSRPLRYVQIFGAIRFPDRTPTALLPIACGYRGYCVT